MKTWQIAACAALSGGLSFGAGPELKDLRHCGVRPDTLDYVLMSVVDANAAAPTLSFNHRDGTTHLVRDGGRIGPYTVLSHERTEKRVFDSSINAHRTVPQVTAKLRAPDGRIFEVRSGIPHPMSGLLATLVSLKNGAMFHVRPGDALRLGSREVRIGEISEESVLVWLGDRGERVPLLAEQEREALVERHRERQKALATRRKERVTEETQPAKRSGGPPQEAWWHDSTPPLYYAPPPSTGLQVGTDVRYPVAWKILPLRTRRKGRTVITPIAVPTEFASRRVGYGSIGTGKPTMSFPKATTSY